MDTNTTIIILVISLLAFITFYVIGVYNRLVNSKNMVNDKWNEIDKQLKRKCELIPKLIGIVKEYAPQEEAIFMSILAERNRITNAFSINDKIDANDKLSATFPKLLDLSNTYQKLIENDKFESLVSELKEIDEKINYAKEFYNEVASKHNEKISKMPTNLVAMVFSFKKYELFKQEN